MRRPVGSRVLTRLQITRFLETHDAFLTLSPVHAGHPSRDRGAAGLGQQFVRWRTVPVTGKIVFNGEPVADDANVFFIPAKGPRATRNDRRRRTVLH